MYNFFAFLNRMKYIERWSLMRSIEKENISEHSQQTAIVAHALATIDKIVYNRDVDPNEIAVYALFHESSEVLTGDLPTPIKYFNPEINKAYKDLESLANEKLLLHLPEELKSTYSGIFAEQNNKYVKHADKISAYIKCLEEETLGNVEFKTAKETIFQTLKSYNDDAVNYFLDNFIEGYQKTLDTLG